ncbi:MULTISPECIES: TetR/AcrR family transcriptional regulator [Halorussus]|uniref:TetR/AcrR family transcriptional regulator n=1 Tax=Halorussus TaxID=1070314 RepID=UPI000E21125F|nr:MULTISPECIES: TetR/AcrR family transcriptional regulator [Halorussus]NHN58776.1 TetR family transcriptional regulator [Halorussus sp. JP-T4]
MPPAHLFEDAPDDTRTAIMKATFLALCEHGYANLTIQRIGDEFAKSKSLLYHHYDGKDELLVEFLEYMLEDFQANVPREDHDDPEEHLRTMLDQILDPAIEDEHYEFTGAMMELRAQASHDEAYRDHFTRTDRYLREKIADVVRDGVDRGVFREVDPERTAALLVTTVNGSMLGRVTTDDDAEVLRATRRELDDYIDAHLLADDAR